MYIEKSIAETFQLGNFKPIIVNKVNEGKALTIKNLASNNLVVENFFFELISFTGGKGARGTGVC